MKKKLFIGTVLPTVAALAVIGSGFSLWIFSDSNTATANGSISVSVENVVKVGELTIKNGTRHTGTDLSKTDDYVSDSLMTLVFDQTADQTLNTKGKSVHLEAGYSDEGTTKYTTLESCVYNFTNNETWEQDYKAGESDVTFTTTVTLPTNIAKYVELSWTPAVGTFTESSGTYTYAVSASQMEAATSGSFTNNVGLDKDGVTIFDWNSITVSYKDNMEPTTLTAYKTMRSEVLAAGNVSTVYNAVVSLVK